MRGARAAAAALSLVTAILAADAALTALSSANRSRLLFPDLLVATLLATTAFLLQLRGRRWPALATVAAALLLLACPAPPTGPKPPSGRPPGPARPSASASCSHRCPWPRPRGCTG